MKHILIVTILLGLIACSRQSKDSQNGKDSTANNSVVPPIDTVYDSPPEKEIVESIRPELFNGIKSFSLSPGQRPSDAVNFSYPLGTPYQRYRVWYHQQDGRSKWSPNKSKFGAVRTGADGTTTTHAGSDLCAIENKNIKAIVDGRIEYVGKKTGWGYTIYLYFSINGTNYIAVYAHLDPVSQFPATKMVKAGDNIGTAGCSGNAGINDQCDRSHHCDDKTVKSDHLHLEIFKEADVNAKIDPVKFCGWVVEYGSDPREAICPDWAIYN